MSLHDCCSEGRGGKDACAEMVKRILELVEQWAREFVLRSAGTLRFSSLPREKS